MVIDHIGVAVKSIEDGIKLWEGAFGYTQLTQPVINSKQQVKVVFLSKKSSLTVKLIEPTDQHSPVYSFAQRGGGLHHLCFKCSNVNNEIERLQAMGSRIISKPQPGEAFENENIAFVYAKQGLNIELIDTEKRANLLLPVTAINDHETLENLL